MITILYFSTAMPNVTRTDVIVALATEANKVRNIAGALGYNGREFSQCLEGDDAVVHDLMAKIEQDDSHSGVKVIDVKHIESRHFADWHMKLVEGLNVTLVIEAMRA